MYTPRQKSFGKGFVPSPQTPLSFSRELRQVLQERNLLTAKSRRKGEKMNGTPGVQF